MNVTEGCRADVTVGCLPLLTTMLSCKKTICVLLLHGRHIACKRLANVYKFCVHVYYVKR